MPKNTVHGGPTNKADYPPTFGAALAAARSDMPVAGPRYVGTCPVCDQPVTDITGHTVPIEGEPTPTGFATVTAGPSGVKYEPCGHTTGAWDEVMALLAAADAEAIPGGTVTLLASDDLEPTVSVTLGTGAASGDGEPSTFGDVTAAGGTGGSGHADPNATAVEITVTAGPEGGEQPSPGNSSSTSPKKRQPRSSEPKPPSQSRARTTGSRSKKPADSSTAASADDTATNSADN